MAENTSPAPNPALWKECGRDTPALSAENHNIAHLQILGSLLRLSAAFNIAVDRQEQQRSPDLNFHFLRAGDKLGDPRP